MVFKRRRRSTRSKRRPRPRSSMRRRQVRKRGKKTGSAFTSRNPIPASIIRNFSYWDQRNLDASNDTPAMARYRTNSIWDPQWAVGGHKVRGMDPYGCLYQSYEVLSSSCQVTYFTTSDSMQGFIAMDKTGTNALGISSISDVMEMPHVRSHRLTNATNGNRLTTLVSSWSSKQYQRHTPSGNKVALFSTDPLTTPLYTIGIIDITGVDPSVVKTNIKINYRVRLFNPIPITLPS